METRRRVVVGWRGERRGAAQTPQDRRRGRSSGLRPQAPAVPKVPRGAGSPGVGGGGGGVTQAGAVDSGLPLPPDAPLGPYLGPPAARGRRAAAAAAGPGATGRRAPWVAGGQRRGARLSASGSAGSKLRPSLRSQRWAPAARFNYPAPEEGAGRARRGRGRGAPAPLPRPLPAGDLRAPSLLGCPPSWHPSSKGAQAHGRGGDRDPKLLPGVGARERGGAIGGKHPTPTPPTPPPALR